MEARETPVLVVGAGPAGLTAAITLARQGVPTLLVERRTDLSSLPRATVVSTRSMEIFRSWGLADAILAGGVDVEWLLWSSHTLAEAADGAAHPVGYPTREQSAVISPTGPACVPQDHLEPVLMAHLRTLPAAEVALGTEVVGLTHETDAVRVTLRDRTTGAERFVRAGYVVAGDGAHSTVRRAVGIPMHGPDDLLASATVLFHAPLWELLGPHRYGIYAVEHPEGAGIFLPAGPGDRWLYGVVGDDGAAAFTVERLTRLIRLGSGVADLAPRIERIGTFTFAAQLAERFRAGRVFLVGDAAHRVSPRGGTGMNTAIADGYDLGLEARLGAVRVGRRGAARHVRVRAPAGRRAQRRPLRRPDGLAPAGRRGAARRPRADACRTCGCPARAPPPSTCSAPASRCSPGRVGIPGPVRPPGRCRRPSGSWTG